MRTIHISIEEDESGKSLDHDIECMTTVNGRYYHNCLREVCNILMQFERKKKLTIKERKVVEDIAKACSPHFRGVYHESK